MSQQNEAIIREQIDNGATVLGIELGSTRIKAVLIDSENHPVALGGYAWENTLSDGVWTYALDEVWSGVQGCFAELQKDVESKYGTRVKRLKALGFSGMMHGYLVFDKEGEQLTPFRTWRNNITEAASKELTELFQYTIPQRWSIAHLYQAILNGETHVGRIAHATTLAGYVHWKLTGRKAIGIGEASGMFSIDVQTKEFDAEKIKQFDRHIEGRGFPWKLGDILPEVLNAGEPAGQLTEDGARLIDPGGQLEAGIPLCPPEGDAGTGMVATNSISVHTGNVSAGTSVFALLVLEKALSKLHP